MKMSASRGVAFRYRIHWHVWLVHFPISFFVATFIFQLLHLYPQPLSRSFEVSSNVMLIAGTIALIPATWTGWNTWKRRYDGVRATIFQRKIITSFVMLPISVILTVWRVVFLPAFEDVPAGTAHWLYFAGTLILIAGSVIEGFYGIRLSHK